MTEEFRAEFVSVAARLIFHPDWLCYAAVGPSCGEPPDFLDMWNVTIPGNKPPPEPLVRPSDGLPTLRVVQISDIHMDLAYKPGAAKQCGEPLCCREGNLDIVLFVPFACYVFIGWNSIYPNINSNFKVANLGLIKMGKN